MKLLSASVLAAVMPIAGQAEITVIDPWARASVLASRPGAAYLTLTSDEADRLLEVTSPGGRTGDAPRGRDRRRGRRSNGSSRCTGGATWNAPVTLAPGHMHLMLLGLSRKLKEGESFPLTLVFESAGEVQ